jgi:hypothetical protein
LLVYVIFPEAKLHPGSANLNELQESCALECD